MTISGAVMQGGQALSPDGALYVKLDSGSAITGTTITATTAFNVGDNTVWLTKYAAKQLMISGDGTGTASGMTGWILGNRIGTESGLWASAAGVPTASNAALLADGSATYFNAAVGLYFTIGGNARLTQLDTAGAGPSITAGTATTDVNALSITQTWNAGGTAFTGIMANFTDTASAAGTLLMDLQVGGTSAFKVAKSGGITIPTSGGVEINFTGASNANITNSGTGDTYISVNARNLVFGATANDATDLILNSSGILQFAGSTSSFPALKRNGTTLEVKLADDSAYAPIAIGNTVNAVSPTSPNRTVTINIGGTTYYLAAKTTND